MLEINTQKIIELSAQKKAIEDEINALKKLVVDELKQNGLSSTENQYGTFTIVRKPMYSFSEDIKKLEETIELKKVEEIERNIATVKYTEYLLPRSVSTKK